MRGRIVATLSVLALCGLNSRACGQYEGTPAGNVKQAEALPPEPTLCLDGFCPVTLKAERRWEAGAAECETECEGRISRFASNDALREFQDDPAAYAPAVARYDVVELAQGTHVEGDRRHGVFYGDTMYLFANEANLEAFWDSPDSYTVAGKL